MQIEPIPASAAELARQRRLYEAALSSIPDFVYVFSLDHRVLYANDALIKMWGVGQNGAIGKTFLEIGYEPWHAEMHDREIDEVRATRKPVRGEVPFTGTLGRRHYEYIFVPVFGSDGEVEAVAGTTRDVTERHNTEAALRESEERSSFVRRSSGVGFWYCDLPLEVLQWDDLVRTLFHLPPDVVVTIELFFSRLHADDREPVRLAIERSIENHSPFAVDYRVVSPATGAITWIRAIGRTHYASDGAATRFDGVTFDVTDQKLAEERQEFLMRLSDTLRPLSDPVTVQAEASRVLGQYLSANRVLYFEIVGDEYVIERDYTSGVQSLAARYPVSDFGPALLAFLLEGRTVVEFDATTEPNRSAAEHASFASIQCRGHVDVPLVKGGQFFAGLTVHNAQPRVWSAHEVAIIEETAERTWAAVERARVETALRASEERRRLALNAAELGAWQIDLRSNTFTTDERFRQIVTGASTAISYEQVIEAIHPDDRERIRAAVAAATRQDEPLPYAEEYRLIQADGTVRWVWAQGRVTYDRSGTGRLASFDGAIADITARKQAEERQERLVDQLRDQDKRKDEFLATLAHELRNPLAPIRNSLELMKLTGTVGPIERSRAMIERQVTQLVRLVDDLLDVSRVTNGKLELRKVRVDLAEVIEAATETVRSLLDQADHTLSLVLPDKPIQLDADPTRLAQVISNLLSNSARYTPPGGNIRITARRERDVAQLIITDDGIGIPAPMLGKIFDMFTQVDRSLEKSTGGLGIGLSLVKGLVQLHGGTVDARSGGEGLGSEFTVRLPIAALDQAADEPQPGAPLRRLPALRFLVADDNVDSAESLGMLLELLGNEVSRAHDGEQAVRMAEVMHPDVVLLDIGMPKLNGYDACRRIRQMPWSAKTRFIAMTGWGQEEDKRRSREAGFDLHLVKPVDFNELEKLISTLNESRADPDT